MKGEKTPKKIVVIGGGTGIYPPKFLLYKKFSRASGGTKNV